MSFDGKNQCLWKLLHFRNGMAEVTNRNFFAIEPFRQR